MSNSSRGLQVINALEKIASSALDPQTLTKSVEMLVVAAKESVPNVRFNAVTALLALGQFAPDALLNASV